MDRVFPEGASEGALRAIYRPRPGLPFTPTTLADGSQRILWTTFTQDQVDIDVMHPEGVRYLDGILDILSANGVKLIRLDAVGYAVKRAGTSCFMMPETFEFIRDFAAAREAPRARGAGGDPCASSTADAHRERGRLGLRLRIAAARSQCLLRRHRSSSETLDRHSPREFAHGARHARRHRRDRRGCGR